MGDEIHSEAPDDDPQAEEASIRGDLRTFSLLDVLEFLRIQAQTGVLLVSSDRGAGVVRLTQGRVSDAATPTSEPVGQLLVDRGLLDVEALQAVRARIGGDDEQALVALLWQEQLVGRSPLSAAAFDRIMAAFGVMLEWPEGSFSFHTAGRDAPPCALSFDLQELILRLAARRDEETPADGP